MRGTKVQNLLDAPLGEFVRLIEGCAQFVPSSRASCYRRMGKVLAVVTDGRFGSAGCPKLSEPRARRQCETGAAGMEDALETFS